MKLKNKYVFGLLTQYYELSMLDEHIKSCVQMLEGIENPENVTFDFCFSTQEHYEKIDWDYFRKKYPAHLKYNHTNIDKETLESDIFKRKIFNDSIRELQNIAIRTFNQIGVGYVTGNCKTSNSKFYNIADARRDLNYKYCKEVDIIIWGECDSLYPKQTLHLLELLHERVKDITPKYIVNFSDRKLWDNSFAPVHPMFENSIINDELTDEASGKSYMSLERMNEINNISIDEVVVDTFTEPRFDGSCVCFSSELIKSGVNIPHSLLLAGEDTSIGIIAKKLLGDNFVQYNFKNVLHVHNRRHPNKRTGILNETNPNGFCDERKGNWWKELEDKSKYNLNNLFNQTKFETLK
jgi:hypothetical protein